MPHGCVCSDPSINGLCTLGDNPPRSPKTSLQLRLVPDHCLNFASFHQYSNIEPRVINNANVDRNYSVEPRVTGNKMVDVNSNPMPNVIEPSTEATTEPIIEPIIPIPNISFSRKLVVDVSDEKEEGKCIIM